MNMNTNTIKNSRNMNTTAFALTLIGGILMLINGGMSLMMLTYYGSDFGFMWGMMGGYQGMMGSLGFPFGSFLGLMLVALVCGVIVTVGALMFNSRPAEHRSWGIIILIFSVISFVGMGGFFIGAILGVAGGALALS
jgi:hypothetical protein